MPAAPVAHSHRDVRDRGVGDDAVHSGYAGSRDLRYGGNDGPRHPRRSRLGNPGGCYSVRVLAGTSLRRRPPAVLGPTTGAPPRQAFFHRLVPARKLEHCCLELPTNRRSSPSRVYRLRRYFGTGWLPSSDQWIAVVDSDGGPGDRGGDVRSCRREGTGGCEHSVRLCNEANLPRGAPNACT